MWSTTSNAGNLHVRFDERGLETEPRRGYSGTARRKGRQRTNQPYCRRATSRLYRVHAVMTGCFHARQLQWPVCGGEPGRVSVMSRPQAVHQPADLRALEQPLPRLPRRFCLDQLANEAATTTWSRHAAIALSRRRPLRDRPARTPSFVWPAGNNRCAAQFDVRDCAPRLQSAHCATERIRP